MLLSDEGPDLGATVVDHGPEPAAPGATMMLSPDAPGFGQMRPIAKSPTPTLPLGQSSFGPPTPGHAVDSTMMLPEPSGTSAPQSSFAGTMVLPGASEGAPVPWAAPRPPTLAPPSGPPGPQPWTPYAPPQSPQFETPPMMSTMHLRPPAAPQPEPRDPEATNHLLLVGGLSLVFLAVVGVVLKLVVFG
ncbi:MAG: hypothetical protein IPF99_34595 [Deltaproteobacteria bacterium]|nr:hypothetical protein [Deltaproteobacteria bacterium]